MNRHYRAFVSVREDTSVAVKQLLDLLVVTNTNTDMVACTRQLSDRRASRRPLLYQLINSGLVHVVDVRIKRVTDQLLC